MSDIQSFKSIIGAGVRTRKSVVINEMVQYAEQSDSGQLVGYFSMMQAQLTQMTSMLKQIQAVGTDKDDLYSVQRYLEGATVLLNRVTARNIPRESHEEVNEKGIINTAKTLWVAYQALIAVLALYNALKVLPEYAPVAAFVGKFMERLQGLVDNLKSKEA
jgi:hypothetical protein